MGLLSRLLDALFPPRCFLCREYIKTGRVCGRCRTELAKGGRCDRGGSPYVKCVSPLLYDGAARNAMLAYKFRGRRVNAGGFSQLLAECVERELPGEFDIVTWAPVSAKRRRERGFDQSELIARDTAKLLGVPCTRLLEKYRDTRPNSSMEGAESRRENVRGVYRVSDPARLRGTRVLLIDDILTTGATMRECVSTLLEGGAESVVCAAACDASLHR